MIILINLARMSKTKICRRISYENVAHQTFLSSKVMAHEKRKFSRIGKNKNAKMPLGLSIYFNTQKQEKRKEKKKERKKKDRQQP